MFRNILILIPNQNTMGEINVDNNSGNVLSESVDKKHINYPITIGVIGKMKALAAIKGLNVSEMWEQAARECLANNGVEI